MTQQATPLVWSHIGMKAVTLVICAVVATVPLSSNARGAGFENDEPTNLSPKTELASEDDDVAVEKRYQIWLSGLAPEQQAWERVLQKELGGYYLPLYKRDKVAGKSSAWDYVEDDSSLPRVLIIGDSISRAYTNTVRSELTGIANVHRAPANCGPVELGLQKIDVWLGSGKWDIIHFNFGIHNRFTPVEEYSEQLERLIRRLKQTEATLIWATTTPVPDIPEKGFSSDSIDALNTAAAKLASTHGIEVNDLNTAMSPHVDTFQFPNDVHFNREGNEFLGQQVAKCLSALLSKESDEQHRP